MNRSEGAKIVGPPHKKMFKKIRFTLGSEMETGFFFGFPCFCWKKLMTKICQFEKIWLRSYQTCLHFTLTSMCVLQDRHIYNFLKYTSQSWYNALYFTHKLMKSELALVKQFYSFPYTWSVNQLFKVWPNQQSYFYLILYKLA